MKGLTEDKMTVLVQPYSQSNARKIFCNWV